MPKATRVKPFDIYNFNRLPHIKQEELHLIENIHSSGQSINDFTFDGSKLTGLKELDLSKCVLKFFPIEITRIPNLETLYIDQNYIKMLPIEIGNMKKLSVLDLSNNQLTSLPEEIRNMSKLSNLSIEGNEIEALPNGIDELPKLQTLNVGRNKSTPAGYIKSVHEINPHNKKVVEYVNKYLLQ